MKILKDESFMNSVSFKNIIMNVGYATYIMDMYYIMHMDPLAIGLTNKNENLVFKLFTKISSLENSAFMVM